MKKIIKKGICVFSICTMSAGICSQVAFGKTINSEFRDVVDGIEYIEKEMFIGEAGKYRINQLKIEADNKDTGIIFAKEKEFSLGKAKLSEHVDEAVKNGNRVVAGINGDFFNVKAGVSVGPHVSNGKIITSYTGRSDRTKYPLLIQKRDGTFTIEKKDFRGEIKILKGNVKLDLSEEMLGQANIKKTSYDSVNRYEEFIANRYKIGSYTTVATPNYSEDRRLKQSIYAPNEVLVVLKNVRDEKGMPIQGGMKLDEYYTGDVVSIGGEEDGYIPKDGIIIASGGDKGKWLKENAEIGDQIKIKASFGDKNIKSMMAAYSYLVEDGEAYDEEKLREAGYYGGLLERKRSRTALGIDKNGDIVVVTLEGGYRVKEYSDGASLMEFAKLLEEMGLETAVNMDGGGSTQIMLKRYAQEEFDILNTPEDGRERDISNSILFTTKKNVDSTKIESIRMKPSFAMLKNSEYKVEILAENRYGYKVPVDYKDVKWSLSEGSSISQDGLLKSGSKTGLMMIEATYQGKKDVSYGIVISEPDSIMTNLGDEIVVSSGDEIPISAKAMSNSFGEIQLKEKDVRWSIEGNIGKIVDGKLKVTRSGRGVLYCEIGDIRKSIHIKSGERSVVVDNFEDYVYKYSVDGFMGGVGSVSEDQAYSGNRALKVSYDYNTWTSDNNGTINVNFNGLSKNNISYGKPKYVSAMVYGDGKAPWMRAELIDAQGKAVAVDFESKVNWVGWKQVYAEVPSDITYPVKLDRIYFVETHKEKPKVKGEIFIDDIMFLYEDDYVNKPWVYTTDIEVKYPKQGTTIKTGMFIVKALVKDDVTEVDENSISVSIDGIHCRTVFDKNTGEITAIPKETLTDGKHEIIIHAKNIYGESARREKIDILVNKASSNKE